MITAFNIFETLMNADEKRDKRRLAHINSCFICVHLNINPRLHPWLRNRRIPAPLLSAVPY
jgi:hypothetical protein